jgi:hypothetical protein
MAQSDQRDVLVIVKVSNSKYMEWVIDSPDWHIRVVDNEEILMTHLRTEAEQAVASKMVSLLISAKTKELGNDFPRIMITDNRQGNFEMIDISADGLKPIMETIEYGLAELRVITIAELQNR